MARKPKDTPHLRLRIPPALLARLEKSREKSGLTLTGEIVHRIEASFQKDDTAQHIENTGKEIAERLLSAMDRRPIDDTVKRHIDEVLRPTDPDGKPS